MKRIYALVFTLLAMSYAYDGTAQDRNGMFYKRKDVVAPLSESTVLRKKKNYLLNWRADPRVKTIRMELWSGDDKKWASSIQPNVGSMEWQVPRGVKKSKTYSFRLFDGEDTNPIYTSPEFTISPRYPLYTKVGAVVLVAAVGLLVTSSSGSQDSGPSMPDPPELPPN